MDNNMESDDRVLRQLSGRDSRSSSRRQRIPSTLQAVFLAANRGQTVHTPPPGRVASKDYTSNKRWFNSFWSKKGVSAAFKERKSQSIGKLQTKSQSAGNLDVSTRNVQATPKKKARRRLSLFSSSKKSSQRSVTDEDGCNSSNHDPVAAFQNQAEYDIKSPARRMRRFSLEFHGRKNSSQKQQHYAEDPTCPQSLLDSILTSRGYSTKSFNTMKTGYFNEPTELQCASYHVNLVELVRANNTTEFAEILSTGISLNPSSRHGESLVHMLCRRGDAEFLKIMANAGCSFQVADDFGRTPLHDACWTVTPCFETVELILKSDLRLLYMSDGRGNLPLSYVRQANWPAWIDFLNSRRNEYWPMRRMQSFSMEPDPPLTRKGPNTCPLPNPPNALTPDLAALVVAGTLKPCEVTLLAKMPKEKRLAAATSDKEDHLNSQEFFELLKEGEDDSSSDDFGTSADNDDDDESSVRTSQGSTVSSLSGPTANEDESMSEITFEGEASVSTLDATPGAEKYMKKLETDRQTARRASLTAGVEEEKVVPNNNNTTLHTTGTKSTSSTKTGEEETAQSPVAARRKRQPPPPPPPPSPIKKEKQLEVIAQDSEHSHRSNLSSQSAMKLKLRLVNQWCDIASCQAPAPVVPPGSASRISLLDRQSSPPLDSTR